MDWRRPSNIRDVDRNLILACKVDKPADAREALSAGADLQAVNERGESPLLAALWKAGPEILHLLLDAGATVPDSLKNALPSPEQLRRRVKGRPALAEALGRLGYAFAPDDVRMSFADHVGAGHVEEVRRAVAADPKRLLEEDAYGPGPLVWAVYHGQAAMASALIDLGAPLDAPGGYPHGTPLMHALWRHDLPLVQLLVERGADVDASCPSGTCQDVGAPLLIAVTEGLLEAVRLLVQAGADLCVRFDGLSALELARQHGRHDVAAWLEQQAGRRP